MTTLDKDVQTAVAYLQAAQTIIAMHQSLGRPELHTIAFEDLAAALSAPALLAAQRHLLPVPATMTLIEQPDRPDIEVPVQTDGQGAARGRVN